MTKLRIIILALIIAASAVIAGLILAPVTLKQLLGGEGYNRLWQLALGSIIGSLVSAALSELNRERDRLKRRREHLWSFYASALAAYNDVKKARRLLNATVVFKNDGLKHVRKLEYEAQMIDLQDVQLQLESMVRQVHLRSKVFSRAHDLEAHLKTMENYLRNVLNEFEGNKFQASVTSAPLSDFPRLQEFIDREDRSPFIAQFVASYDEVEEALFKLLSA